MTGDKDTLTYQIPQSLLRDLKPGQLVEIPLRNTQIRGIVLELHDIKPLSTQNMNIIHTSIPVTDGLNDDWAGMSGVSFEDDSGRGSADNTANVKTAWDDNYLYFAFEVEDTNLQAVETVRDGALYLDDIVEVYIDTLNNDGSLMQTDDYHFIVNLNNAVGDQKRTGTGTDTGWDCSIVSAVTMVGTLRDATDIDTGYFVELAIPWSDIGGIPLEGSQGWQVQLQQLRTRP